METQELWICKDCIRGNRWHDQSGERFPIRIPMACEDCGQRFIVGAGGNRSYHSEFSPCDCKWNRSDLVHSERIINAVQRYKHLNMDLVCPQCGEKHQ
jgi:hypothetical protein